jgi:hypothetical protein
LNFQILHQNWNQRLLKKKFIEPPNTGNFQAFNRGAKESRNQIIITLIICLGKHSRFWYFLGRFKVDSVPVRVLRKTEETAFMYPNQPMQVFSSIWDGSSWATRGGLDKIDWSQAPFIASCRKFELDACQDDSNILTTPNFSSECQAQLQLHWWGSTAATTLNSHERRKYKYVQENLLVYNYCTDTLRYPTIPPECLITPW